MKSSSQLRQLFLEFFRKHGHEIVPSCSLVPAKDPTLLFTNAGMVQFKDVFLGIEKRPYVRAASSQRCVRAGGKHNDLENVGYTARHHTFFEMLGNFSFGDYFKREAIGYAWDFLTSELAIPAEKLWVTVHADDTEAADIWLKEIGVDPERFVRISSDDNFWSMGDTGPCGPCTEIFYDHGVAVAGGPPGSPDADGDRYVEVWNLVFMQYNRDSKGNMTSLPKPSVDTGMGIERLAAVIQGVHSNYEIDSFQHLLKAAAEFTGHKDTRNNSLRVIADHIRSTAFLIVDGVMPANEGRGYVLRRIIRRAIRHGYELGMKQPFFYKLVAPLNSEMGKAYPELTKAQAQVERILRQEEERFAETLEQGMKILQESISNLPEISKVLPGEVVFKLYDTYGFPVDLTADYAVSYNVMLDMEGYEREMQAQRERARAAGHFATDYSEQLIIEGKSEFTGYQHLIETSHIKGLFHQNDLVNSLNTGDEGIIVLDKTPFYAESGGQVGDRGEIIRGDSVFRIKDTQKHGNNIHIHIGKVTSGVFRMGEEVEACVDKCARQATALNHSATHLLHAALREILGEHVTQKGSLVEPDRLRFDFSHFEPLSREQIARIETLVNQQIRENNDVQTRIMSYDEAITTGAIALFGEKYGDQVRVLSMGEFSTELCGGTHVKRAGDIGLFKIISEAGVASGVRRIEANTGERAVAWMEQSERQLSMIADVVKASRDDVGAKVQLLMDRNRQLEKEMERLKGKLASSAGSDLASQALEVNGTRVLVAKLDGADPKSLRDTVDQLKNKLGTAVIVLATVTDEKVSLVAGVTKDRIDKIKASELANVIAQQVGGKGGGRPDMAQAGGNEPAALEAALAMVPEWIQQHLV